MAGFRIEGNTSGNVAEVTATNEIKVASVSSSTTSATQIFSLNDDGTVTGNTYVFSPETDDDYRLRVAHETIFDTETFNYTAQNTGKFIYRNTTMTNAWTVNGMTTNSGSITTLNTGTLFQTIGYIPLLGGGNLYSEFELSVSNASIATNTTVDIGLFLAGATTPYAPTDGVYFRCNSTGFYGVINFNGTETVSTVFLAAAGGATWFPSANQKYKFTISATERDVEFWVDDVLYATVNLPASQGQLFASAALPVSIRHAIGGTAASAAWSIQLSDYTISNGGMLIPDTLYGIGSRAFGSYQGLSGGTMGSLASYANSTNPTAAAPSNTALTANLPNGLGGQGNVTAAAAAATDGIWCSYQVPAGTVSVQGKRLRLTGITLDAVNLGAAVATTATTLQFSLAFGHTAVSLGTTESATTKAPRRIALGIMNWPIGAAIGQQPDKGPIQMQLINPIYVNPGEFIALVGKFLAGTATASQTIQFTLTYDYSWE